MSDIPLKRPLIGSNKDFVDRQVKDITDRLKEVYGETLPKELQDQISYIVTETYIETYERLYYLWKT